MTDTTMTMLDTMPTTGQFATVHEFAGKVWGTTYKWDDETLLVYSQEPDEWNESGDWEETTSAMNILGYFITEV